MSSWDAIVVGGGPVGLACAHAAQAGGRRVLVLDAGGDAAYLHAAGMLAPVTEAEFGEEGLLELGTRSLALWPALVADVGCPDALRATGTLVVARDTDDAEVLDRLHALHQKLGLAAERLLPSAARRAEPALAPTVRLALDVPGDRAVDPLRVVAALRERLEVRTARVTAADARGVTLEGGERLAADRVVLAAGLGTAALADVPIRPVKGQVLRLRDPRGAGLVTRSIRTPDAYLVPRGDGRYVLGATMEERGHDTAPTAGGLYALVRDLSEVVPGVLELEVEGFSAGLRPMTPDGRPLIVERDGLIIAAGHGRNGILLAPVTAELVVGLLDRARVPA
jgi:glycine oxidase